MSATVFPMPIESMSGELVPECAVQVIDEIEDSKKMGRSTLGLVELLLKNPTGIDALNRLPAWQRELFPRLLLISEVGFLIYAAIMALLLNFAPASTLVNDPLPSASWRDGGALGLVLAYTLGVFLAAGVCLPSFYFYSLLAGVKMSWLQITSLIGKGSATNAVLLLGVLPIYVAGMLGLIVLGAPAPQIAWGLRVGLVLPFFSGLWGLRAIYVGILDLGADPSIAACARACFLRRLTFSWAAVYAVVVPVMIYSLWGHFARLLNFA